MLARNRKRGRPRARGALDTAHATARGILHPADAGFRMASFLESLLLSEPSCEHQQTRGRLSFYFFLAPLSLFFAAARSSRIFVTTRSISSQGAGLPVQISNAFAP